MKILHTVHSYIPARHGMSELVSQISERLVARGHTVTVATCTDPTRTMAEIKGVSIMDFNISGGITQGIKGEFDRYIQFILKTEYDILVNFHAQVWSTDLCFPLLPLLKAKKILVPTGFSMLQNPKFHSYYEQMSNWLNRYDKVVYHSANFQDAEFASNSGLHNGVVIPNGAAEEEFDYPPSNDIRKDLGIQSDRLLILHASGYIHRKGHNAAWSIFNKARIPHSTIVFVSPEFKNGLLPPRFDLIKLFKSAWALWLRKQYPPEIDLLRFRMLFSVFHRLFGRQVIFCSLPRNDYVNLMKTADIFLFPSEIECSPIVLYESLAAGTPFLATDVGNVKEIVNRSGAGMLLPTEKKGKNSQYSYVQVSAAAEILRVLAADREKLANMGSSGYEIWKTNFTWEKIADQYEAVYSQLINTSD